MVSQGASGGKQLWQPTTRKTIFCSHPFIEKNAGPLWVALMTIWITLEFKSILHVALCLRRHGFLKLSKPVANLNVRFPGCKKAGEVCHIIWSKQPSCKQHDFGERKKTFASVDVIGAVYFFHASVRILTQHHNPSCIVYLTPWPLSGCYATQGKAPV